MRMSYALSTVLTVVLAVSMVSRGDMQTPAQAPSTIDFAKDVQPIFRQHCIGCHGPSQQMNGFRLDRRRDAMRGGTGPMIGPGNSEASRMYLRLLGQFGQQMPLTGALAPAQIKTIKEWIDQGAVWPDEVSGETAPVPADPDATRLIDALRLGDLQTFRAALKSRPASASARGAGGITPLMAATLYGDLDSVRSLLERGADPNAKNEAGATALMWAVPSLPKTQALIERGANVNARSDDGRTPLMIAAGLRGGIQVVELLLARGADPSAIGPSLFGPTSALAEAAYAGDEAIFKLLLDRGADLKTAIPAGYYLAHRSGCQFCATTILEAMPPPLRGVAATLLSPPLADATGIKALFDQGADVNARSLDGSPLLAMVAASETAPADMVAMLMKLGGDVHAKTPMGESALYLAKRQGATPVVDLLTKAGGRDEIAPLTIPTPSPASSAREAMTRSIPLLQRSDVTFLKKSGCVSCHNNSLTAMTIAAVRQRALPIDREIATRQANAIGAYVESWRERALQHIGIPGDADTISYILLGLAAENYPANAATDAMARFLKHKQAADGRWWIFAHRPPIESSDFEVTAASMRAMQVYAPRADRAEYQQAIDRAAAWLKSAKPTTTEDRAFQLLGLRWANVDRPTIDAASRALLAMQRADGGWSQLATLTSDAYATGQALVALAESGAVKSADPAYQRGVQFLLKTQLADGSWFVPTRAVPIQPLFNADFPHGKHAFISAAATGWATMALALGSPTN
jgi:ankyrin repeat protein